MTTALDQLAELAACLGVDDRQRRTENGESLRLVCSHPERLDEDVRKKLAWAGVIARLTNRSFELRRMPAGADEKAAFRSLLGIERGRSAW